MSNISNMIVPLLIAAVAVVAASNKVDAYSALLRGAGDGLSVTLKIFPALVGLLTAVYMLRASGFTDFIADLLSPVFNFFGIPPEVSQLIFIRPISGSGALAVGSEIISQYGPDSYIGRVAAVMLGSTETTFYTISVYFGAVGIKNTRHAIPAALLADLAGFIASAFFVRILF